MAVATKSQDKTGFVRKFPQRPNPEGNLKAVNEGVDGGPDAWNNRCQPHQQDEIGNGTERQSACEVEARDRRHSKVWHQNVN